MPSQHAKLSPSAASRWLNCTAAPTLEAGVPDMGSPFAEEGTLAHAYCAKALKEFLGLDTSEERREIHELAETYHTPEMDEHVETYKTIVLEKFNAARAKTPDAQLLVEVRLDLSEWAPGSFGTSDAIIIADGTMEVVDFKYGKGVRVEAEENAQMRIYALGAYSAFAFEYRIERIRMTIVQPRLDNLSEAELSDTELLAWGKYVLKPNAEEAAGSNGVQRAGEWCRFCKARATCIKYAALVFEAFGEHEEPKLLTPEQMAADVLPRLDAVKTWLRAVEDYTLEQALAGVKYDGYKLVEGRSVRRVTDMQAVRDALAGAGFDEAAYMKPRELRTLTELEKLLGKKTFAAACGQYIEKPQGKPTLVPVSDKRPELNRAEDDFAEIPNE